jgi:hypothetical protein
VNSRVPIPVAALDGVVISAGTGVLVAAAAGIAVPSGVRFCDRTY